MERRRRLWVNDAGKVDKKNDVVARETSNVRDESMSLKLSRL